MSYTQLIIFKDGKADGAVEYRNAWGGSARIWTALFDAHVPKKHEYDSWLANDGNDRRLWDLAKREDLPMFERAAHAFTFDHFYVRNEHFGRFAADLRAFVAKHPTGERVDHLPAWAQWLDENNGVEAVGLYGTSVSENIWYRNKTCPHCENSIDEMEPVPLTEGTEVYDWLEPSPARMNQERLAFATALAVERLSSKVILPPHLGRDSLEEVQRFLWAEAAEAIRVELGVDLPEPKFRDGLITDR